MKIKNKTLGILSIIFAVANMLLSSIMILGGYTEHEMLKMSIIVNILMLIAWYCLTQIDDNEIIEKYLNKEA